MKPKILYYASSHALTPRQLYIGFKWRKYLRENELVNTVTWNTVCAQVLRYAFYLIIDDIIENKVKFKMPPRTGAFLEMMTISGDAFKQAYQRGAFNDIDYLATNFSAKRLCLTLTTRYGEWKKAIHVSGDYKDRIIELTNKGEEW